MSASGDTTTVSLRRSRASFLRGATLGGGVAAAGFVLAGRPDHAESAGSAARDADILTFVLQLEHLQSAFYGEAFDKGSIVGEARELARVVGGHERAHVKFIEDKLGSAAPRPPRFDFGSATSDVAAFFEAGRRIEDIGVRAYNAQAPNLTVAALGAAAKIVSVEARHAAWIRDLAGVDPAPDAAEPVLTAEQVQAALRDTGFIR